MKNPARLVLFCTLMLLQSCATPVIKSDLMQKAAILVPWSDMGNNPDAYRAKLYVLGGIIVSSRLTETGSLVEAAYVPVDANGYLLDINNPGGRFMAFYPKAKGILDPLVYRKGRMMTLVAEFVELRQGKIDEMSYTFPFFEIVDLYLWQEARVVPVVPYPYPWYPYPWHPYPYWPYYGPFYRPWY